MTTTGYCDASSSRVTSGWVTRVETSTTLIENMTSLGGVTTRIEARARWEGDRVPPGLLRLSVGLEDAGALWGDLEAALAHV